MGQNRVGYHHVPLARVFSAGQAPTTSVLIGIYGRETTVQTPTAQSSTGREKIADLGTDETWRDWLGEG